MLSEKLLRFTLIRTHGETAVPTHVVDVEIVHWMTQIFDLFWWQMKILVVKVVTSHPQGTMTKLHCSQSSSHWDISVWLKKLDWHLASLDSHRFSGKKEVGVFWPGWEIFEITNHLSYFWLEALSNWTQRSAVMAALTFTRWS